MSRAVCIALVMTFAVAVSSEEAQSPSPTVVVQQVKFEGAGSVPVDVLKAIERNLVGQALEVSGASANITFAAKQQLVEHGYARAVVAPLEVAHLQGGAIAVTIPIDEGPRYSFGKVHVFGAHVFSASDIEAKFPVAQMRGGDFSGSGAAMQAVQELYDNEGYIDFYFKPFFSADDEHRTFDLNFEVNEGHQYRVGKVTILGLDAQATKRVFDSMQPGSKYSKEKVTQVAMKYALPLLNPWEVIDAQSHRETNTVDVTFDFRQQCPPWSPWEELSGDSQDCPEDLCLQPPHVL